jgi:hypothetical protein
VKSNVQGEHWIKRAQAFVFYVLRNTFKWVWDDGWADWKALLVMSVATNFAAISVAAFISILLQHRVLLPDTKLRFVSLWGTIGVCVLTFNYYTLVSPRKWTGMGRDFLHHPKFVRIWGGVAVWASVLMCLLVAEWVGSIARKLPPLGN